MYDGINIKNVNLDTVQPTEEPQRQYYFISKCRQYVKVFERENGRLPKACVTTFGCQMNPDSEIRKTA
ncbi:MAG: hypothetical protein J1E01_01385 [Acetatifactor sp.]|nr:hypothetical protein [Acetatifactor sp.]